MPVIVRYVVCVLLKGVFSEDALCILLSSSFTITETFSIGARSVMMPGHFSFPQMPGKFEGHQFWVFLA